MITLQEERRDYSRLDIEHRILLFLGPNKEEILCEVKDISEKGICFKANKPCDIKSCIRLEDEFWFQYVDVYKFGNEYETKIIAEKCKIIRINENNSCYDIGCAISSRKFYDYVKKRKLVTYL